MKVFISSVRRGLEEERDALPGLIRALGHEPRLFENFTAKKVPSRDACLSGVEESGVYVLLLGEHYGDPLPDTGKAPTEEEFTVARRRGIPILVFRKRGVTPDDDQAAFIKRIEDYATGLFRGAFATATELLAEVAAAIRELEQAPTALSLSRLTAPVSAPWKAFEGHGWRSTATAIEIHAIPIPPTQFSATVLTALPGRLARAGRECGLFTEDQALDTGHAEAWVHAATKPDRQVPIAGVRVTSTGTVSVWREMPSDMLGVILDPADLAPRIATMLRLAAELLPRDCAAALAIGLYGLWSVMEGQAADLGHRSSGSMPARQAEAALVEARDSVPVGALESAVDEIARELALRLILRFREVTRW